MFRKMRGWYRIKDKCYISAYSEKRGRGSRGKGKRERGTSKIWKESKQKRTG